MNYIQIIFSLFTSIIIISSTALNFLESRLPTIFSECIRYGKFAATTKSNMVIQVPKSWFKHFYVVAFFEQTFIFGLVLMVYCWDMPVPSFLMYFLDTICGKDRITYIPKHKVFIALTLLTLQVYRRFYDTHKISVFGEKAKINLMHYLVGLVHYPGAILAIICEAPLFADSYVKNEKLDLLSTSFSDKIAILIFLWAWKHQYVCNKILADLRKNKEGKVVNSEYKLPEGDWFEYLTAPHQTAEIIMYGCLMWILWNNITWFFVFSWVVCNQVETILLSHWWYQKKFENFPKKRKALIPFLY
ncbi:hypothetical protein ABEB36_005710 [Hypothenemus hampei]|uniref:Polyprenal reductase n=1 Tax=Hypothenemus hampei TaxID=57062 RepID=A0ABD1EZ58_HYPHA